MPRRRGKCCEQTRSRRRGSPKSAATDRHTPPAGLPDLDITKSSNEPAPRVGRFASINGEQQVASGRLFEPEKANYLLLQRTAFGKSQL